MTEADIGVSWARIVLASVVVFGLLALLAVVLKYIKMGNFVLPGVGDKRERRMQVVESLAIDPRRRLVFIRRDEKEHLLLLGAHEDIVVETNVAQSPSSLKTKSGN